MAAPSPTPRVAPTGIKLDDGFSTKVTLSSDTNIELWEKTVTPPGADGGDPIPTDTMWNVAWRTVASRALKTLTDFTFTAGYDPVVLTSLVSQINIEQTITITFPDGSTWAFYGFLRSFQPGDMSEGAMPEATVTITPTNWDPTNKVEAGPAVASVTGT